MTYFSDEYLPLKCTFSTKNSSFIHSLIEITLIFTLFQFHCFLLYPCFVVFNLPTIWFWCVSNSQPFVSIVSALVCLKWILSSAMWEENDDKRTRENKRNEKLLDALSIFNRQPSSRIIERLTSRTNNKAGNTTYHESLKKFSFRYKKHSIDLIKLLENNDDTRKKPLAEVKWGGRRI